MQEQSEIGTRNATYDLISVCYHALQAVETCLKYRADAEQEGDEKLVKFFDEVIEKNRGIAERCKSLLPERFGSSVGSDEEIGRAEAESYTDTQTTQH